MATQAQKSEEMIKWGGGACPVEPDAIVEVQHGCGGFSAAQPASFWGDCWGWPAGTPWQNDIIAYRVVAK